MADVIGYTHNGADISPSLLAADWQGATNQTYYNVDGYTDKLLPKGQRIVQLTFEGAPNLSEYFLPYEQYQEVVSKYGHDSAAFEKVWQLAPYLKPAEGLAEGKTKVEIYELKTSVIVAEGKTCANVHLGSGGGTQIFLPLAQELKESRGLEKIEEFKLTNTRRDLAATSKLLKDAKGAHRDIYGKKADPKYPAEDLKLHEIPIEKAPEQFKAPPLFDTAVKTGKELTGPARELAFGVADIEAKALDHNAIAVSGERALSPAAIAGEKAARSITENGEKAAAAIERSGPRVASAIAEAGQKITHAMPAAGEKAVNAKNEAGGNTLDTVAKLARNEHGGISLRTIGKGALHGLAIAGAAMDLHDIATSDKPLETGLEKAGGWGGALAGAELFGAVGTAIEPGLGTVILGGIGGVIGYYHGEKAVRENMDVIKGIVTGEGAEPPVVTYPDGSRWTTYWVPEMGMRAFSPVRENHIDHGRHTENGVSYEIVPAKELCPDVDNLQLPLIYTNPAGEKCTTYWDPEKGLVHAPLQAHPSLGIHTENGITYDVVHESDLYPEADKRKLPDIYTNEAGEKLTVYWNPDLGPVEAPVQQYPYHGYHTENGITYKVAYVEGPNILEEVVVTASRLQKGEENAQSVQQEANSPEKAALNSGHILAFNPAAQLDKTISTASIPLAGENNPNMVGGQQPDSIGARTNIHDTIMNMQKLEKEQEELKKERDQYKGEPLTREKAEQLAKTSYVTGEDAQLAQQSKALQAERAQLEQNETRNNEIGREYRFDSSFWRYVPQWMKSDELKDYEHNTKVIAQKKQDLEQRESEIAAKTEKLQERLQTPEARAAINEKVRQYLEQDAERLTKLERIDTKLDAVQKEMSNNMQQATGLPVKQGSHSPEQSMAAWQRISDIMHAEPRPDIPGMEKLLMGEAREYRIQAKAIIEREGYWPGRAADMEIAGNMYMKGYSKERVSLAFMDASPETVNNTISQNIQYGRDIAAQAFTPAIQHNLPSHGRSLSI